MSEELKPGYYWLISNSNPEFKTISRFDDDSKWYMFGQISGYKSIEMSIVWNIGPRIEWEEHEKPVATK